ncbi:MAG: 16S rRNA processing protein RimM [Nitrospirae bacterium]|nr:MAG: 16S rRNA processing protein RimM [Nitrospirota bacterium]
MEKDSLIAIGRIAKEWGIKGEMIVTPMTPDAERFKSLERVAVESARDGVRWMEIRSLRSHKNMPLISFKGIDNPEDARKLRGALVKVDAKDSPPLPDGVYYQHQIIGLEAATPAGDILGKVEAIIATGSNDVYVVKSRGRELLVPAIKEVVKKIDLKAGKIIIEPMETIEE